MASASSRPKGSPYAHIDAQHKAIGAYFLGPQAENYDYYKELINLIVNDHREARQAYHSEDGAFVTQNMQLSPPFRMSMANLRYGVEILSNILKQHSAPFWSPRYSAHMCMDTSMPASLAYFMTMLYNPNNVAIEASPITTELELRAGRQLCRMLGYKASEDISFPNYNGGPGLFDKERNSADDPSVPEAWGHITCDGTVANLESIWAARNLKFYPLSLLDAMESDAVLKKVLEKFEISTCKDEKKLFKNLTNWERLNLRVSTILEIPERLKEEFGVAPSYLEGVMKPFSIQSTGQQHLEIKHDVKGPIQYMVSSTRHYSWPKGGAIVGIGSNNIVNVQVDNDGRLDISELKKRLSGHVLASDGKALSDEEKKAVFAVVAVIGSTEEGAVDPLDKILKVRKSFEDLYGLTFVVHADAAWGGYFTSTLNPSFEELPGQDRASPAPETPVRGDAVPTLALKPETITQLMSLRDADSITIDPHKSGYIPYPAGGLCYRDGRMRYLLTWTTPYITPGTNVSESIGIYGVEGSKPGAAAAATFLSNKVIGIGQTGYGRLLGEVRFTSCRFFAQWSAMETQNKHFIIVPFNKLPGDEDKTKEEIQKNILEKRNSEIMSDEKAMALLRTIGSDLNINAFCCNFFLPGDKDPNSNGELNQDVEQANDLNKRIVDRLSISSPKDDPADIDLFLTSTVFEKELYGTCAENYKARVGVKGPKDLFVLRNVVMSPFPTDGNFIKTLAEKFKEVAAKEVEISRELCTNKQMNHSFIVCGDRAIYLIYEPRFLEVSCRQQAILSVELDDTGMQHYKDLKEKCPGSIIRLITNHKVYFSDILEQKCIEWNMAVADEKTSTTGLKVSSSNVKKLLFKSLQTSKWDDGYPQDSVPFYLFGKSHELHIEHKIVRSPNIQLSAGNIEHSFGSELFKDEYERPLFLVIKGPYGNPFRPGSNFAESNTFGFKLGESFDAEVYESEDSTIPLCSGKIELKKGKTVVFTDKHRLNRNPLSRVISDEERRGKWSKEVDKQLGRF